MHAGRRDACSGGIWHGSICRAGSGVKGRVALGPREKVQAWCKCSAEEGRVAARKRPPQRAIVYMEGS